MGEHQPLVELDLDEEPGSAPGKNVVRALQQKGLPYAYLAFAGEQHGFRKSATIQRTLEAELYFYGRVFGFELADPVEPVPIQNLPA